MAQLITGVNKVFGGATLPIFVSFNAFQHLIGVFHGHTHDWLSVFRGFLRFLEGSKTSPIRRTGIGSVWLLEIKLHGPMGCRSVQSVISDSSVVGRLDPAHGVVEEGDARTAVNSGCRPSRGRLGIGLRARLPLGSFLDRQYRVRQ